MLKANVDAARALPYRKSFMQQDIKFLNNLINNNAFLLFNLPYEYIIDKTELSNTYHLLQKKYHPDNFIGNKNISIVEQLSAHINQCFNILSSPIEKALLLLEIYGHKFDISTNHNLSPQLLIRQIELHEEIDVAKNDIAALQKLEEKIKQKQLIIEDQIDKNFNMENFTGVQNLVLELAFYNRLNLQIASNINNLW